MTTYSEIIEEQKKRIAKLEKVIGVAHTQYLKYSRQCRAYRAEVSELHTHLHTHEALGFTEAWVEQNQELAANVFWQLWRAGAEVELDPDSREEIFLGILSGADDITDELWERLQNEYS